MMIDHIDRKRADLGLPPPMYAVPYAPKAVEAMAAASRPDMRVGVAVELPPQQGSTPILPQQVDPGCKEIGRETNRR